MSFYKVSVIMPVYNVEEFIEEALLSLVNQTMDNFEVIAINDGSTDSSLEILNKFAKEFKFIKVYEQKNQGLSATRNRGIDLAEGKYIYFMDSDDYIEKNSLESMYNISEQRNLDLLLFSGKNFYDRSYTGKKFTHTTYERVAKYPFVTSGWEIFDYLINNKEYYSSACLYFIRKKVLDKANISFYENIIHEDELFTFQLLLSCDRVSVINEVFFYRRVRNNSIITKQNFYDSFIGYYTVFNQMLIFKNKELKHSITDDENIQKKIGQIYGFVLNKYINLDKTSKERFNQEINQLKVIGEENNFFNRKEFMIFNKSEKLYYILYKIAKEYFVFKNKLK